MESFSMISATACFLGIVITVLSKMYPSDKFEKQMKTIFSLVFMISILTPVLNGNLQLPDISQTVAASSVYYQEISVNADEFFIKSVENNISARLEAALNSENIFSVEIQTSVNISDSSSISINEVNVTVTDIELADEVKKCICANLGEDVIIIVKMKEGQYEHQ